MLIQVNSDNHITGSLGLVARVEDKVKGAMQRFADHVTRIEVHLNDENSTKSGERDKRCAMEARVSGRQPIAVDHLAPTLDLAVDGAVGKLARAVERATARQRAARPVVPAPDPD